MSSVPSPLDCASGEAASAGFTSFSNKEEKSSRDTRHEVEAVKRRLRRMQSGVICAARYLDDAMRESGLEFLPSPRGKVVRGKAGFYRAALITLTYARAEDWQPTHIRDLLAHYRKYFKRNGYEFRYVWTLEMQKRGAPHYHVVCFIPERLMPPLPDQQGWWKHGRSNAIFAESPVGYIAKYASKGPGGRLPVGARIWGYGGLSAEGKFAVARALAPRWLRKVVSPAAQLKRVKVAFKEIGNRGRELAYSVTAYLDKLTGFTFLTPWCKEGFSIKSGLALRHQGYVEAICPEGDIFRIHQPQEGYA